MRYLLMIFLLLPYSLSIASENKTTIGWIETVRLLPEGFDLQAKIDTGADNSSLGIVNWKEIRRDDDAWVQFEVRNNKGQTQSFERPLDSYTYIKRREVESIERPVVKMWVCLGTKRVFVPVNLAKRKDYKYRMLIGRSFLVDHFLVNSSVKLTQQPDCVSS